jgi:predicted PilT family ATPase
VEVYVPNEAMPTIMKRARKKLQRMEDKLGLRINISRSTDRGKMRKGLCVRRWTAD